MYEFLCFHTEILPARVTVLGNSNGWLTAKFVDRIVAKVKGITDNLEPVNAGRRFFECL